MNSTQVPAIPESSDDLHPNDMEAVVLAINFQSLKLCSTYPPAAFHPLVKELRLGTLHCAANARDEICLQLGAQLEEKGASEEQLQREFEILSKEKETPRGKEFKRLEGAEPDQDSDNETVLRALNHQLKLGIVDYREDVHNKLIAACSIGLSQLGRIIDYEPKTSLADYCWRVHKRLKEFPNSWHSSSRPIRPPFAPPPLEAATERRLTQAEDELEDLRKELRGMGVKNNLNLNVRVDNGSDGQFNNKLDEILQRLNEVDRKLDAMKGGWVEPPCTPADGADDSQYINIQRAAVIQSLNSKSTTGVLDTSSFARRSGY